MMSGTYDMVLVSLSFLVAVIASYTALELSRRVASSKSKAAVIWLIAGAFSMGTGIWTMHFVGMLAFSMPMAFSYNVPITILSLIIGVGASAFAIFIASRKHNSLPRICLTGLILGCGIAGMHYTGMAAMEMKAAIIYNSFWVATSVVIAIVAAIAAIWIAFTLTNSAHKHLQALKFGAAFIMGIAICGMHYTGMLAASYQPLPGVLIGVDAPIDQSLMAVSLAIAALIILGFTHLTIFFDYQLNVEKKLGEQLSSMVKERTAALEQQTKELLHNKENLEQEIQQRTDAEKEVIYLSEILDESSNEIYIISSETLNFVKVNQGAINNLGFDKSDFDSMTPMDINPSFDKQTFTALLERLKTADKNFLIFETQHKRKDGSTYPVQAHVQLCRANDSPMILASITDITEFKNMEQRLIQAEKMQSIGQLAAGIAHEINTPIQYIGDNTKFLEEGFTDLLNLNQAYTTLFEASRKGTVPRELLEQTEKAIQLADINYLLEEVPVAINQSQEGISHISHIVQAMKDLSHPGEKNFKLIDLNKIISNAITITTNEWKYIAEIETKLDEDLPFISALSQEISQAIMNLIVNASHAIASVSSSSSGEKGVIKISTQQTDDYAEIKLSDTGCGIPDEIRKRVFDPFFTTKEVGKGTGQGLSMAYSTVVDKHNGILELESELGVGTAFTIRLPLDKPESLQEAV